MYDWNLYLTTKSICELCHRHVMRFYLRFRDRSAFRHLSTSWIKKITYRVSWKRIAVEGLYRLNCDWIEHPPKPANHPSNTQTCDRREEVLKQIEYQLIKIKRNREREKICLQGRTDFFGRDFPVVKHFFMLYRKS